MFHEASQTHWLKINFGTAFRESVSLQLQFSSPGSKRRKSPFLAWKSKTSWHWVFARFVGGSWHAWTKRNVWIWTVHFSLKWKTSCPFQAFCKNEFILPTFPQLTCSHVHSLLSTIVTSFKWRESPVCSNLHIHRCTLQHLQFQMVKFFWCESFTIQSIPFFIATSTWTVHIWISLQNDIQVQVLLNYKETNVHNQEQPRIHHRMK